MDKYNIIFISTPQSQARLLGRTAQEFVLREFADFQSAHSRIVKEDAYQDEKLEDDLVNIVLPLDMPLVKKADVLNIISSMRAKGMSCVRLGSGNLAKICSGDSADEGVFANEVCFLRIDSAKSYNVVYNHLKERILNTLLSNGVGIIDNTSTFVDDTVSVERGALIMPFCRIEGSTVIKSGASVGASYIKDSTIEGGASVEMSHIVSTKIGARTTVGPFARLRGANIEQDCRIGDFVEIKASLIHEGVKAAHLSYIGDADVGDHTNVGCGTVFCNYDGVSKHKTTVGSECFIGANTNLIAPVVVGDNAFIAAGTTVTRDIDNSTFTIGRVRQDTKIKK